MNWLNLKLKQILPILTSSIIALFAFSGCNIDPVSGNHNGNKTSGAKIIVSMDAIGSLAKNADIAAIDLAKMMVIISKDSVETARDSAVLSGITGGQFSYNFSHLEALELYEVAITVRDTTDKITHQGYSSFTPIPGLNIEVPITLNSKYTMIKANFFPIPDSATSITLSIDSLVQDSMSFSKGLHAGDTLQLTYDYMTTGVSHDITMRVYGEYWGFPYELYRGDSVVVMESGQDSAMHIVLKWVGPDLPPDGHAEIAVTIGPVGTLVINGEIVGPEAPVYNCTIPIELHSGSNTYFSIGEHDDNVLYSYVHLTTTPNPGKAGIYSTTSGTIDTLPDFETTMQTQETSIHSFNGKIWAAYQIYNAGKTPRFKRFNDSTQTWDSIPSAGITNNQHKKFNLFDDGNYLYYAYTSLSGTYVARWNDSLNQWQTIGGQVSTSSFGNIHGIADKVNNKIYVIHRNHTDSAYHVPRVSTLSADETSWITIEGGVIQEERGDDLNLRFEYPYLYASYVFYGDVDYSDPDAVHPRLIRVFKANVSDAIDQWEDISPDYYSTNITHDMTIVNGEPFVFNHNQDLFGYYYSTQWNNMCDEEQLSTRGYYVEATTVNGAAYAIYQGPSGGEVSLIKVNP